MVYFGVATKTDWSVPVSAPIEILIDSNRDGTDDYELTVNELSPGSDLFAAVLCKVNSADCHSGPVNGVLADVRDTAPYNSDVLVLPVRLPWLNLPSGASKFNYSLGRTGTPQTHTFDVAHPGLVFGGTDYLGATATQPLYQDLDGQAIQVTYTRADYTANAALGVLLLHHHNAAGGRAQVLQALVREPRKQLKR
jgi:hypothetical protein